MSEKKKYLKVERPMAGGQSWICDDPQAILLGELDGWEDERPGEQVVITVVEMTEEEYENLPEFGGW